jgi:hypothetical protein
LKHIKIGTLGGYLVGTDSCQRWRHGLVDAGSWRYG